MPTIRMREKESGLKPSRRDNRARRGRVGCALGILPSREGRSAFTLIELLVVMAIIGILLTLLMPSLQQARRAADRLTCGSQLREVGVAIHAFNEDHGRLPGPINGSLTYRMTTAPSPVARRADWQLVRMVYPYFGLPQYHPGMRGTEVRVMRCPVHRRMGIPSITCYLANRSGPMPMGSNNRWEPGNATDPDTGEPLRRQPLPLNALHSPARMPLITDGDFGVMVLVLHQDARNVLFADGHVEPFPTAEADARHPRGWPPVPAH